MILFLSFIVIAFVLCIQNIKIHLSFLCISIIILCRYLRHDIYILYENLQPERPLREMFKRSRKYLLKLFLNCHL